MAAGQVGFADRLRVRAASSAPASARGSLRRAARELGAARPPRPLELRRRRCASTSPSAVRTIAPPRRDPLVGLQVERLDAAALRAAGSPSAARTVSRSSGLTSTDMRALAAHPPQRALHARRRRSGRASSAAGEDLAGELQPELDRVAFDRLGDLARARLDRA